MERPIIEVDRLSKSYQIGNTIRHDTLRDAIGYGFKSLFKGNGAADVPKRGGPETIWALKDVSFEVHEGEVLGIIGKNGAGKSTLLKILSRITDPTEGKAVLRGRVASLLEVGTGFHPELTGRENIFLNGAILGMTRREMKAKLDEIIAFAEVEKFIDTPVKRYSSGMYVRLAFAVAAHLEPEILIVDEVLAVGDAAFQKKCLGKMGEVAKEGRTVILVSHNMNSISKLCSSAVWIDNGQIRMVAEAEKAVQSYLASGQSQSGGRALFVEPEEDKEAFISSVELKNKYGDVTDTFDILSPINIEITFCCRRAFKDWRVNTVISRYDGITVIGSTTRDYKTEPSPIEPGVYRASLLIPGLFLASNSYMLTIMFAEPPLKRHDVHENIIGFKIVGETFDHGPRTTMLVYPFEWRVNPIQG